MLTIRSSNGGRIDKFQNFRNFTTPTITGEWENPRSVEARSVETTKCKAIIVKSRRPSDLEQRMWIIHLMDDAS
jgi:hypothetical protein